VTLEDIIVLTKSLPTHKKKNTLLTMPSSRFRQAVFLLAALTSVGSTDAFVAPQKQQKQQVSSRVADTELYGNTKTPPSFPSSKDVPYGEASRQYRRTVYTHDDWVKHRSPDRFIRNLALITSSGVYKNLANEVAATTSLATLICLYNAITGGVTDFEGVKHAALIQSSLAPVIGLPLAPFTLSSPSLGLLLGQSHSKYAAIDAFCHG
jgi:hypothetical protein